MTEFQSDVPLQNRKMFKISGVLSTIIASLCFLICEAYAETPSIIRVSPDTQAGWQTFASEVRLAEIKKEGVITKPDQLQAVSKLRSIDRIEPIMLTVVLLPGKPIEEFGASVVEFLFVELRGKGASGDIERCIAVLTRTPYQDRMWSSSEEVSGTHVTPPLRSVLPLPNGSDVKKAVLNYLKKVFEPGVCMGAREEVINVVVYESNFETLLREKIADSELKAVFARASK